MLRRTYLGIFLVGCFPLPALGQLQPEFMIHCESGNADQLVVDVDLYITGHPMGGPGGLYSGMMRVQGTDLATYQGYTVIQSFLENERYGYRGSNWAYEYELEVERTMEPFTGTLRMRPGPMGSWWTREVSCERT